MEWPTRECGNTASVQACNLRPPWHRVFTQKIIFYKIRYSSKMVFIKISQDSQLRPLLIDVNDISSISTIFHNYNFC
jgi:hypothetical protein